VRQPQVFLMDEPLSNLDAKLRVQMRAEITELQHDLEVTTIYVTHDQVEAMTMGDRIAVMRKGVLQQYGAPESLYEEPVNLFVAEFIGSPAMNLVRGVVLAENGEFVCKLGEQRLPLTAALRSARPALEGYRGRAVAVGVRPEHLLDPARGDGSLPTLRARVTLVETLPPEKHVHLELAAEPVVTEDVLEVREDIDAAAVQGLEDEAKAQRVLAVARFDSSSRVEAGSAYEFAVAVDRLHFFDLDTGQAIR
jgi:multiple sugar transport system ATP-binding protein